MTITCEKCQYRFQHSGARDAAELPAESICPRCGAAVDVGTQISEFTNRTTDAGGAEPEQKGSDIARRSLGQYEILEEISRGAMGVVYKAKHRTLNRVVALKVMIAGEHASKEQIARFDKEARAAARLRHPNVVTIYDVGIEDGKRFFTMDFIEGTPLDVLILRKGLTPRRALEIAAQLSDALQYAHKQGVIHRDIKPSNIMIDDAGRPQIMDFGLAKQLDTDSKFTRTGTTIGTPSYMSPEQARGETEKIEQRSDVYSLGAVMYEMLTGEPPFTGETMMNIVMKVIHDEPRPLRRLNPKLHRDIQTIVLKTMEKEPGHRYQSMGDLAADIRRYMAGEMITARPAGLLRRAGKAIHKHRTTIIVGLAIAALVSGVAGTVIHILREEQKEALQQTAEAQRQQQAAQRRAEKAEREQALNAAEQVPEWEEKFTDDFSGAKLDPAWKPSGKEWAIEDGRLAVKPRARRPSYITLEPPEKLKLEGNVAVEFIVRVRSPNARAECFLGAGRRTAHTLQFSGGYSGALSLLEGGKTLAQVSCPPLKPDVAYRVRIERSDTSLHCQVRELPGGATYDLSYDHPALLLAMREARFGLVTWTPDVSFDDVRTSRAEFARPNVNQKQSIDYLLFSSGQLKMALREYKALIEKYSDNVLAVLAEHNCGLIQEALAADPRELKKALEHYRSFEDRASLLSPEHKWTAARNKERIFFVLASPKIAQFQQAADTLAAMCAGGERVNAGSVWGFPDILARCAGAGALDSALKIMQSVRFDGAASGGAGLELQALWEGAGPRVRNQFGDALSQVCRGFADQKRYEQMKSAFGALPDTRARPAFEYAVNKTVRGGDAPVAIDLLSFAWRNGMTSRLLDSSALALADQFINSKQYQRVVNVHTAYPAKGLSRQFGKAVTGLAQSQDTRGAIALLEQAVRLYPAEKRTRTLRDPGGLVMAACVKEGLFEELRRVYATFDDAHFSKHLVAATEKQTHAGQLEGAGQMLDFLGDHLTGSQAELRRLAAALAAKYAPTDRAGDVLRLHAKYPSKLMAAPLAAAISAAARAEDPDVLERLITRATGAFPKQVQVTDAAREAAKSLVEAGETEVVVRVYQEAAKAQGEDKATAAALLVRSAEILRGGEAHIEAAAAYTAAAQAVPKDAKLAGPALVKAGVLYELVHETEEAEDTWKTLRTKYPGATAPAAVAALMDNTLSVKDFRTRMAKNPRLMRSGEIDFFVGLRAATVGDDEAARQALKKAVAQPYRKGAWYYTIAETILDGLPEPEPPRPPEP